MKKKEIRITLPDGRAVSAAAGQTLAEIARAWPPSGKWPVLAARVDRRLAGLHETVEADAALEWVTYAEKDGRSVYQRTASFILFMAVQELYHNTRLVIGHSIANGFYYDFFTATPVNPEMLVELSAKMREIVSRDLPFSCRTMTAPEARDFFRRRSMCDTLRLIEHSSLERIAVYENGGFANFELYPLAHSTGAVTSVELKPYGPGLVMLFPDPVDFRIDSHIGKTKKLFEIYRESNRWGQILGVNDVGRLNEIVGNGGVSELIKVSESLHEKKTAQIADVICGRREELRLVLISGPSASGKTTFSKRLAVHLRVNGIRPLTLSLDNYFVDRELCPRDESGEYDFEALETVDLELFNRHLQELQNGRNVPVYKFDFEEGRRKQTGETLRLEDDQVLIVEGIHCLNEKLTAAVPARNKFKIYVSALTQLLLDDHHRISTTDTRILRRMVRDVRFRGYRALDTLKRFASVSRGEQKYVFPFQESADAMFNSWLVYELAVLKEFALPLLEDIEPGEEVYPEAQRLATFLRVFRSLPEDEVPMTSILREFIGGSSFKY